MMGRMPRRLALALLLALGSTAAAAQMTTMVDRPEAAGGRYLAQLSSPGVWERAFVVLPQNQATRVPSCARNSHGLR